MKRTSNRHRMDGVFVLLLFAVFAGSVLLVLLFGASSYEKLVKRDNDAYNQRTGISYIAAKLRHYDSKDCIYVGSFSDMSDVTKDEINTIYLKLEAEGEVYYTKIYYYDGYLREVLCVGEGDISPEYGSCILAAKGLVVRKNGKFITIGITNDDGSFCEYEYWPRSQQEGF